MENFVDAYAVLGVAPDAPQEQLKAAHRELVRRHHPDRAAPAERDAATERMREVNVAYGLVRDSDSRARYDRIRQLHAARRRAERLRDGADDAALAEQWERLARAAGRWAGVWMRRNQGLSYRAGRAVGRWLS